MAGAQRGKRGEKERDATLGKPKYYIDTPGLQDGETYAWFPTLGDSMTDDTAKSIPSGSLVLGRQLTLNSVADVPLHRPIVVIQADESGRQCCVRKSACAYDRAASPEDEWLRLRSYNPAPRCDDFWIPFSTVNTIFVVERVRLPSGREFVPRQEEVIRKRK